MNDIHLKIALDEANLILEALGNLPFVKVYTLIGKIQQQAGAQLNPATPPANGTPPGGAALTVQEQADGA
jgi:hypothetical protein